jgi:hypothetical protein
MSAHSFRLVANKAMDRMCPKEDFTVNFPDISKG